MVGKDAAPAYYVTVLKDKVPKGFYWVLNTNKTYDTLKSMLKNAGLNMEACRAPAELNKEATEYIDQTITTLRASLPDLVTPVKVRWVRSGDRGGVADELLL